jgi:hypothetical protein
MAKMAQLAQMEALDKLDRAVLQGMPERRVV